MASFPHAPSVRSAHSERRLGARFAGWLPWQRAVAEDRAGPGLRMAAAAGAAVAAATAGQDDDDGPPLPGPSLGRRAVCSRPYFVVLMVFAHLYVLNVLGLLLFVHISSDDGGESEAGQEPPSAAQEALAVSYAPGGSYPHGPLPRLEGIKASTHRVQERPRVGSRAAAGPATRESTTPPRLPRPHPRSPKRLRVAMKRMRRHCMRGRLVESLDQSFLDFLEKKFYERYCILPSLRCPPPRPIMACCNSLSSPF